MGFNECATGRNGKEQFESPEFLRRGRFNEERPGISTKPTEIMAAKRLENQNVWDFKRKEKPGGKAGLVEGVGREEQRGKSSARGITAQFFSKSLIFIHLSDVHV